DGNGTYDLNGSSQTFAGISDGGVSSGIITNTGGAASVLTDNEPNSTSHTFSGTITNGTKPLSLTKGGAGTLTLSASNSYTGATRINGGSLIIAADQNLGAAPASATAGSLIFSGGGTLATTASVVLNANRGITLNAAAGGALNVASGTTLTYNGVAAG